MQMQEIIKLLLSRSLEQNACNKFDKLVSILKPLGINGVTYSCFQKNSKNAFFRNNTLFSDRNLVESHIANLRTFPQGAFVEKQRFPLYKNGYFSPLDPRYSTDLSIRNFGKLYGIKNIFCLNFYDGSLNKSELYWFYTSNERPDWFISQIENLPVLNTFVLYFRDTFKYLMDKPLLTINEINSFTLNDTNTSVYPQTMQHSSQMPIDIKFDIEFKRYIFGDPFNEPLTRKEFEKLRLSFLGYSAKEIAQQLNISPRTVEKSLEHTQAKTNSKNIKELKRSLLLCPTFLSIVSQSVSTNFIESNCV